MIRFAFAVFLVAATFVFTTPALSQQDLEQPSAPGGLGNTRADLDRVYGAVDRANVVDLGDYVVASASYADGVVIYLVADGTTPSSDDRAIILTRYADAWDSWNAPEAIAVGNQLLPVDAVPTSDLLPYEHPNEAVFKPGTVFEYRQTFSSESIARLFPNPELYREGDPGTVWLLLRLDYSSSDPSPHFLAITVQSEHP